MLLFSGAATAQVDWSLSSNFVSAAEAGGPALGLADPVVRDIQEDGKGRMWFATQKGVSCYDGKSFKSYLNTPSDSLLWKNWGCHFLTADATGRIWLATTFKLFYFEEKKDKFIEYDLSKVEPDVQKGSWMAEIYLLDLHDEGSVWFRKNDGVYAIDARSLAIRKALTIPLEWRSVSGLLG
ncbi:MAG TPA: two-component regulator propeller domain-containing protein, partial [Saprospiraceae bacterium]|nr:two-component regulator propeller domain-containing protein [Saprospiraceae bacterium]